MQINRAVVSCTFLLAAFTLELKLDARARVGLYLGYTRIVTPDPFKGPKATEAALVPTYFDIDHKKNPSDKTEDLIGFMKFKMGGFTTHELFTYFFHLKDYDWKAKEIGLDQKEHDLASGSEKAWADIETNALFSKDGKLLSGRLDSNSIDLDFDQRPIYKLNFFGDVHNKLDKNLAKLFPGDPIINPLTGEYIGECEGKRSLIQIEAIKQTEVANDEGRSFPGMLVIGRRGVEAEDKNGFPYFSNVANYDDISYDFYKRTIKLRENARKCQVSNRGIHCGKSCYFKRVVGNHLARHFVDKRCSKAERVYSLESLYKKPVLRAPYKEEEVFGDYIGNLHLEGRNRYIQMKVTVSPRGKPSLAPQGLSQPKVKIKTKVYSGISGTNKSDVNDEGVVISPHIEELFPPQQFTPLYLRTAKTYITKIIRWTEEGIVGNFYARDFGKIGTFELVRKSLAKKLWKPFKKLIWKDLHSHPRPFNFPSAHIFPIKRIDYTVTMTYARHINLKGFVRHDPAPGYFPFHIQLEGSQQKGSFPIYLPTGKAWKTIFDPFTGAIMSFFMDNQTFFGRMNSEGALALHMGRRVPLEPLINERRIERHRLRPSKMKTFELLKKDQPID